MRPEDEIISETMAEVHVVDDRQDLQDKDNQGFNIPLINPDTAVQGEKNKSDVHKVKLMSIRDDESPISKNAKEVLKGIKR